MGRIRSTTKPEVPTWQLFALPAEVEAALVNWGRWASGAGGVSYDVNPTFREALRGHRWASGGTPTPNPVDIAQARAVERTMCAPGFSPLFRQMLVLHYVRSAPKALICQVLHLGWRSFEARLQQAGLYFWSRHAPANVENQS